MKYYNKSSWNNERKLFHRWKFGRIDRSLQMFWHIGPDACSLFGKMVVYVEHWSLRDLQTIICNTEEKQTAVKGEFLHI